MEFTILSNNLIILNTTEKLELKIVEGKCCGDIDKIYLGDTVLIESNISVDSGNPKWRKAKKQLQRIMNLIAEDLADGKSIIDVRKYQNWKYVRKDY